MKAIQFIEPWSVKCVDVSLPEINQDEVLIKVKAVGVCGTDLELLSGDMPHIKNGFTKYPLIPGHEWAGEIVEVGNSVKSFNIGDRVTGDVSIGCGCCYICRTGRYNLCPNRVVVGSYRNKDGAYAEYLKMPERHLYKLPDNISYEEGALVEPAATSAYAVMKARIGLGEKVLVIGDGPIGQLAVQCAKIAGATKVINVGSWDEKLEVAKQLGADAALNYKKDDMVAAALELTNGEGVDTVIETSGNKIAFNQSIKSIRPGGKIALLSFYSETEISAAINNFIIKDAEMIGILASPNAFKPTLALMETGRINVKPLITHKFPLHQAEEALEMVRSKKECKIKVLLIP
ncbi:MAG: alcohol dehydrogenase catalytic domain-containing protein [Clostridia bacterium]|nr:alcohol dehydrogenase catalytic domain-containing protein [Clostridia bacterium]